MAVRTKGRRKTIVGGRSFVWFVTEPSDYHGFGAYELRVISSDKRLYLIYPLGSLQQPLVFVSGKDIGTMPHYDIKYRCPRFEREDGAITPQSVKGLIQWCLSDGEPKIRVDWNNKPI